MASYHHYHNFQHYSPLRARALLTTCFHHSSLNVANRLQFLIPNLRRSSSTLPSHLNLGCPIDLLPSGFIFKTFLLDSIISHPLHMPQPFEPICFNICYNFGSFIKFFQFIFSSYSPFIINTYSSKNFSEDFPFLRLEEVFILL